MSASKGNSIERVAKALHRAIEARNAEVGNLRNQLNALYAEGFAKDRALQADLRRLDASEEYGEDDAGVYRWARFTFEIPENADANEALETYLCDHGVRVDWKNQALLYHVGDCLTVNEEGDVFEYEWFGNARIVIKACDYNGDLEERARLVEAWCDGNGVWLDLFRQDAHGNIFRVNAPKKKRGSK